MICILLDFSVVFVVDEDSDCGREYKKIGSNITYDYVKRFEASISLLQIYPFILSLFEFFLLRHSAARTTLSPYDECFSYFESSPLVVSFAPIFLSSTTLTMIHSRRKVSKLQRTKLQRLQARYAEMITTVVLTAQRILCCCSRISWAA